MDEQLVETWLINNRVTRRLLEDIGPEGLAATLSTRGGRSNGQQLIHVLDVIRWKVEAADRELARALPALVREQGHDRDLLVDAFERSGETVAAVIRRCAADGGRVKGFRRGLVPFLGYLIAHEAHHRGHILLTMKQCKVRRSDRIKMGLWDWNRI